MIQVILAGEEVKINWGLSTDENDDIVAYVLERSINGQDFEIVTTLYENVDPNPYEYIDPTDKDTWETVQYRVRSYDSMNQYSMYTTSNIVSVINMMNPTNMTIISATDHYKGANITITWDESFDPLDTYPITYDVSVRSCDFNKTLYTDWEPLATAISSLTYEYTIADTFQGRYLQYRVRSYNGTLYSEYITSNLYLCNRLPILEAYLITCNAMEPVKLSATLTDADNEYITCQIHYCIEFDGGVIEATADWDSSTGSIIGYFEGEEIIPMSAGGAKYTIFINYGDSWSTSYVVLSEGVVGYAKPTKPIIIRVTNSSINEETVITWSESQTAQPPCTYKLTRSIDGGDPDIIYTGPDLTFLYAIPEEHGTKTITYTLTATDAGGLVSDADSYNSYVNIPPTITKLITSQPYVGENMQITIAAHDTDERDFFETKCLVVVKIDDEWIPYEIYHKVTDGHDIPTTVLTTLIVSDWVDKLLQIAVIVSDGLSSVTEYSQMYTVNAERYIPDSPFSLNATQTELTNDTFSKFKLTWNINDLDKIDYFKIWASADGGEYVPLAEVSTTYTTLEFTNNESSFSFKVLAVSYDNMESNSTTSKDIYIRYNQAPTFNDILHVTRYGLFNNPTSKWVLQWNYAIDIDNNMDKYDILYSINGGSFINYNTITELVDSYEEIITMTDAIETIQFKIVATDKLGLTCSILSEVLTPTYNTPPTQSIPYMTNQFIISNEPIYIYWPLSSDINSNISYYELSRSIDDGEWEIIFSANEPEYIDEDDNSEWTNVKYRIIVYDELGLTSEAGISDTLYCNTAPSIPPDLIVGYMGITEDYISYYATWGASIDAEDNLSYYEVLISLNGEDWIVLGTVSIDERMIDIQNTDLTNPSIYIRVCAYDTAGARSPYAESGKFDPGINTPPTAPSEITTSLLYIAGSSKVITWGESIDVDNNIAYYVLERSINGLPFEVIYTNMGFEYNDNANDSSWITVMYRVKAVDSGNLSSDYTSTDSITIVSPPATPINIMTTQSQIQASPNLSAKISWDMPGTTGSYDKFIVTIENHTTQQIETIETAINNITYTSNIYAQNMTISVIAYNSEYNLYSNSTSISWQPKYNKPPILTGDIVVLSGTVVESPISNWTISWPEASDPDSSSGDRVYGYHVYYMVDDGVWQLYQNITSASTRMINIVCNVSGRMIAFAVTAYDSYENESDKLIAPARMINYINTSEGIDFIGTYASDIDTVETDVINVGNPLYVRWTHVSDENYYVLWRSIDGKEYEFISDRVSTNKYVETIDKSGIASLQYKVAVLNFDNSVSEYIESNIVTINKNPILSSFTITQKALMNPPTSQWLITWEDVYDVNDNASYITIEYMPDDTGVWYAIENKIMISELTSNECDFMSGLNAKTITFRIYATDTLGLRSNYLTNKVTVNYNSKPHVVSQINVPQYIVENQSLTITWTKSDNPSLRDYIVYISINDGAYEILSYVTGETFTDYAPKSTWSTVRYGVVVRDILMYTSEMQTSNLCYIDHIPNAPTRVDITQ